MEEIINRLGIETIRPKLEFSRRVCASLASELENPRLTITERAVIAVEWGQVVKEGDILALFADLLRRREREREPVPRKIGHYPAGRIRAFLKAGRGSLGWRLRTDHHKPGRSRRQNRQSAWVGLGAGPSDGATEF